jgi:hypothetical protein
VDALKSVVPKDKLPSEIFASVGAAWLPDQIYSEFARDISGMNVGYSYVAATAQWLASNRSGGDYSKNNNEFGTPKMGANEILFHLMNSKGIEIKKRVEIDGQDRYVTDEEATEAVRLQADKIRAHWDGWIWKDADRADTLTKIYNDRFNRVVNRSFDGRHLSLIGMNPSITLLEHQKNGVWRGLQDRVMLLDQVVGAGKTYEMIAMAMEMRRLGIAKKPMIVVPNHLTLQWRSDFYRLYPGANVLAASPQDFEKDNRERLFSKIVTGNWDAVIVGHTSLKKLQTPVEAEKKILKEQFDDIARAIEQLKNQRGDRNIIRDMEKIKENLSNKLAKLKDKGGEKDKVVDFGDLGVDALFIDELHEFKNLFFTTQMNRVSGLGNPAGSGKAFDLFVKIRWLQDTFGDDAPLITATGTPVSNSLSEMFTMQRFMQYQLLKDDDLHLFDAWSKQYGDVQTVYEVAPSGNGYRLSQRFSKFKNLGSLMGSYRSFADVITLDDLKAQEIAQGKTFPVPKIAGGKPLNIVAQRSPLQEAFFGVPEAVKDEAGDFQFMNRLDDKTAIVQSEDGKWILQSGGASKSFKTREDATFALISDAITPVMTVDPNSIVGQFDNLRALTRKTNGKINALSLTSLANKAGLDYRIIDPNAQDFADSKINIAVRNMLSIYEKWQADRGVQLVFCDLSVPLSAKAKMASNEKRIYVRDDKGEVVHKKGTLHVMKGFEGLPYYLVAEGKGKDRTFTMYDPVSGVILRQGFDSKSDAHAFAANAVAMEDGQKRWLDLRESARTIEAHEIDDYKNHLGLDNDGDAADFEISAQDIEGVTGTTSFSVYDDMKAKLVAAGVPAREVEFIHDHDTPQAKEALFKRVNAGEVRFLFGSTAKMGAGTNVQQRLVGLHHIDAPWRPSDLEQREGRIIRRGNLLYARDPDNFEVAINRYATSQTYDTRRWQLLEHKASGVQQLRNYSGESEIEDVATEASNSADMKAAASGNPLILKETQLATEIKKLRSLERAHVDKEYMIRSRMHSNRNFAEKFGPELVAELNSILAKRDSSAVLGSFNGHKLSDRDELITALSQIAIDMDAIGNKREITYRGATFGFEKVFLRHIAFILPDGNKHSMESVSPSGCITRMENFVNSLESKIAEVESRIGVARTEEGKMAGLLGRPFDHADALAAAILEQGKVQRALMKANSTAAIKPMERPAFEMAVRRQKERLMELGFGEDLRAFEADMDVEANLESENGDHSRASTGGEQGVRWFDVAPDDVMITTDNVLQQKDASVEVASQLPVPNMEKYILVAADSIASLRKVDVYRVLVESNRPELRDDIAAFIRVKRPDLVGDVDAVLAEQISVGSGINDLPLNSLADDVVELDLVNVDHFKTQMVESLAFNVPDGWLVMNAARPLVGNETLQGESVVGQFYALIDPADYMAEKFVEKNEQLDARLLVKVPMEVQCEMALVDNKFRDAYLQMDVRKRFEQLRSQLAKFEGLQFGELDKLVMDASKKVEIVVEGTHIGQVVEVTNGIVAQKVGRDGKCVRHDFGRLQGLDAVPVEGDLLNIRYRNGVGMAQREVGIGVAR